MITFPRTVEQALAATGTIRAGGTELQVRRRLGLSVGPLVDLRDLAGLDDIREEPDGSLRLGARLSVAQLAEDPRIVAGRRGLAEAADTLATPQIRRRASLGGAILQDVRCAYFRDPSWNCLKRGGPDCPLRNGATALGVLFDHGPCATPHPSTLAMALLAYDAEVELAPRDRWPIARLMGDASNPQRANTLPDGAVLTHVLLPPPDPNEGAAYLRATSRERAEWPEAEVLARLVVESGRVVTGQVAAGGVANRPVRLTDVEEQLAGLAVDRLEEAANRAADGAEPLRGVAWKKALLVNLVAVVLETAAQRAQAHRQENDR